MGLVELAQTITWLSLHIKGHNLSLIHHFVPLFLLWGHISLVVDVRCGFLAAWSVAHIHHPIGPAAALDAKNEALEATAERVHVN